jgi:hypothetical protein
MFMLLLLTVVAYNFITVPEERWHTLRKAVPICVDGRKVTGPIVLSALDARVMMVVRQRSVRFADIVVIYFYFHCISAPTTAAVEGTIRT